MNLLLLLSALLSALTGISGTVRHAEPAAAVAERIVASASEARSAPATVRPSAGGFPRVAHAEARVALVAAPRSGPPLFFSRRRE